MAEVNIEITRKRQDGGLDIYHPITTVENVLLPNGNPITTDYVRQPGYAGPTGGSATAYTATLDPPIPELIVGIGVVFIAHVTSGTNPTLNPDGKGAKPLRKPNGQPAKIVKDGLYTVRYSGTAFILQGEGGEYGTAGAPQTLQGYTVGTENGVIPGDMVDRAGDTAALAIAASGAILRMRASEGYRDGVNDWVTHNDPNWIAQNIPNDIPGGLFGKVGTMRRWNGERRIASGNITHDVANRSMRADGLGFTPGIVSIIFNLDGQQQKITYQAGFSTLNGWYVNASGVTGTECTWSVGNGFFSVRNDGRFNSAITGSYVAYE